MNTLRTAQNPDDATDGLPASADAAASSGGGPLLIGWYRTLWLVGCTVFGLQAVGLLFWSRYLWDRFDLTTDFATFSQAWSQIGTGHLNPYETTFAYDYPHYGYPFWQSHFEIIMWPLALLRLIWSSPFVLLIVQDVALAGLGLIAFRFGLELLQKQWTPTVRGAPVVGAGLLVVLVASPWIYWAASFDFHFQPLAALFVLLCARDVWNGRSRAWWWAAAVLLCGDVAASYLIGLGIAAVLSGRTTRRQGVALLLVGVAWVVFVIAIGSGKASSLAGNYGYLAHVTNASGVGATLTVLVGIARHPGAVFDVLRSRWGEIYKFLAGSGSIGIFSALGIGMSLVVLIPNALNRSPNFVGAAAAFQNVVAATFIAVGGVTLLAWVVRRRRYGPVLAALLGIAALAQATVVSVQWMPRISPTFQQVDAPTAAQLARVEAGLPGQAEVIVSQGVIGRFGGRAQVYPFIDAFGDGQTIPISSSTVVFVFVPRQGVELATARQTRAAIAQVRAGLHGHQTFSTPNITVFIWHPPRGTGSVHFAP